MTVWNYLLYSKFNCNNYKNAGFTTDTTKTKHWNLKKCKPVKARHFYFSSFKNPDRRFYFFKKWKKIKNKFFIADRMKNVSNLKKKRNKLSKKLYFTMQRTLSVRKNLKSQLWLYLHIYFSTVVLHQYVL